MTKLCNLSFTYVPAFFHLNKSTIENHKCTMYYIVTVEKIKPHKDKEIKPTF